ncbi:MAG TPA: hypothetical protein VGI99_11955, partial [Gemmataceae bacterium]
MRFFVAALLVGSYLSHCTAADVSSLVQRINTVGPDGANAADASAAWRELSRLPASDLPRLLAAIDGASPAAANWLLSAVDAVVEREHAAGRTLPLAAIELFLRDTRHAGRGRRLAYELLCSADPTTRARLLPTMIDDPAAELRFDAVEAAFTAIKQKPSDAAAVKTELRKLLSAARDGAQIDAIVRELAQRGETVD